jgi:hypothetical protein
MSIEQWVPVVVVLILVDVVVVAIALAIYTDRRLLREGTPWRFSLASLLAVMGLVAIHAALAARLFLP